MKRANMRTIFIAVAVGALAIGAPPEKLLVLEYAPDQAQAQFNGNAGGFTGSPRVRKPLPTIPVCAGQAPVISVA